MFTVKRKHQTLGGILKLHETLYAKLYTSIIVSTQKCGYLSFDIFTLGTIGIFVFSFLLNMIPFAGPSNLFIAANISILFHADPILIGTLVALGASVAKTIHYFIIFFVRRYMGEQKVVRIEKFGKKVMKYKMLAIFVVAATPIPDEPVIIPLGLARYSPVRFFVSYFAGKFGVAVPGAYFGQVGFVIVGSIIGDVWLIILSVALTVAVTVVMLKWDIDEILRRVRNVATGLRR